MALSHDFYVLLLAGLGALVLMTAWLPMLLRKAPLSLPILCVGAGAALFALPPLRPFAIHPLQFPVLVERLSELVVIVSLMGAGLKIDRILDVDIASQRGVAAQAEERAAEVRASPNNPAFRAALVPTGPEQRRAAIVPVIYKGMPIDGVRVLIQDLYDNASQEVGSEQVLVVAMDIANSRPYSVIAMHDPANKAGRSLLL